MILKVFVSFILLVFISSQRICKERRKACTREYKPVCGWYRRGIRCLKYPCAGNFSNHCTACSDKKVAYTTNGKCPTRIR